MEPIGLITWIVLGIATGWAVGRMLPKNLRLGMAQGDAIVGMLGALFGGTLFNIIAEASVANLSLSNTLAAFGGAIVLLFLLRAASEHGKAAYLK